MSCCRITSLAAALVLGGAGVVFAWPWNTDMYDQPSVKPQQEVRKPVSGSIPVSGKEKEMSREEASRVLKNTVKPDKRSLENGKKIFDIYCAPCHGPEARGDGPVTKKFPPPPDLHLDLFRKRTDGWIYGTIRDGGPLMPSYGDVISPKERWDVVNYLRDLQRKPPSPVKPEEVKSAIGGSASGGEKGK